MNANQIDFADTGRRGLAAGVLKQAARDLRRFRRARSKIGRELYADAYDWVTADDFSWPFSFLNVCRSLNLPPESMREELMSDLGLGTFRYFVRRLGSAAQQSRRAFSRFFAAEPGIRAADQVFANSTATIAV